MIIHQDFKRLLKILIEYIETLQEFWTPKNLTGSILNTSPISFIFFPQIPSPNVLGMSVESWMDGLDDGQVVEIATESEQINSWKSFNFIFGIEKLIRIQFQKNWKPYKIGIKK